MTVEKSIIPASIHRVDFHGYDLQSWKDEQTGTVYSALRPMVEAMGLSWAGQLQRLKRDELYTEHLSVCVTHTDAGPRETVGLALDMLPMFLASINRQRVREDIRPTLLLFQQECAKALADYWTEGVAVNPRTVEVPPTFSTQIEDCRVCAQFLTELGVFDDRDKLMLADIARTSIQQRYAMPGGGIAALPAPPGFFLSERLSQLGYKLNRRQEASLLSKGLARQVASEYRTRYGKEPGKSQRFVDGAVRPVNWYVEAEAEWIDPMVQSFCAQQGLQREGV